MIVALGFVLFSTAVKYLPVFPPEETEDAKETADGEWLAPNVLRQPLFSSTTLALVLGGAVPWQLAPAGWQWLVASHADEECGRKQVGSLTARFCRPLLHDAAGHYTPDS